MTKYYFWEIKYQHDKHASAPRIRKRWVKPFQLFFL